MGTNPVEQRLWLQCRGTIEGSCGETAVVLPAWIGSSMSQNEKQPLSVFLAHKINTALSIWERKVNFVQTDLWKKSHVAKNILKMEE